MSRHAPAAATLSPSRRDVHPLTLGTRFASRSKHEQESAYILFMNLEPDKFADVSGAATGA